MSTTDESDSPMRLDGLPRRVLDETSHPSGRADRLRTGMVREVAVIRRANDEPIPEARSGPSELRYVPNRPLQSRLR